MTHGVAEQEISGGDMAAQSPESAVPETMEQDSAAQADAVVYLYLEAESGKTIDAGLVHWDEPELTPGAVVHVLRADGRKQFYTVRRMAGEDTVTVYLAEARNIIWKVLLLGAMLVVCWFGIDWLVNTLFR